MTSRVFAVGVDVPGDRAEAVPFRSGRSLFDSDIILFSPSISSYECVEQYAGLPLISESDSQALARDLQHWRSELKTAVESGKVVFVFLPAPEERYYHTGTRSTTGTGRSSRTTRHVAPVSSYDCLPFSLKGLTARSGQEMSSMEALGPLAAYWAEFGSDSEYQVYFEADGLLPVLGTKKRERVVGALITHASGGAFALLPSLTFDIEALTYTRGSSTFWRKEAISVGARIIASLEGASDALRRKNRRSAVPAWVLEPSYRLAEDARLLREVERVDTEISRLAGTRREFESRLEAVREMYGLLYETGHALEHSIRLALAALGFTAHSFREGESEFDVVFSSPEGRLLGEAEGKDNKAVNIDKMSQLERNLQEDFARDEITEYAKGVLFGNAMRLVSPTERGDFFTAKCISAAKRLSCALVRTPDLFHAARIAMETDDPHYAKGCRDVLFAAAGEIVQFPGPPTSGSGA